MLVRRGRVVPGAIGFEYERGLHAVEVSIERAQRVLAPELGAVQAVAPDDPPQRLLGWRRPLAKGARPIRGLA